MFSYEQAFSRNIGWVSAAEQEQLRRKRVAVAGLGGVGGSHLLALARLGVGAFHIADFDAFELANFNRQAGALVSTLGRAKTDVLAQMAKDINPEIDIRSFPSGVSEANLEKFLQNVDVYVDGLDFFAFEARRATFAACARKRIPAITAAPLGMGAALLNFMPGRMTFEQYFRLEGLSEEDQAIRFLVGLSPAMLQRGYLVDRRAVDLSAHKGPSTVIACELCAGMAVAEALKIMLKRGKVYAAPVSLQFDAYRGQLRRVWRPWGNRSPWQRIAIAVARRQLGASLRRARSGPPPAGR